MRAIDSAELLDIWERCRHQGLVQRSLQLLAGIYEVGLPEVARLSIGDRDARLLQFRERVFGTRLLNMAECPACGGKAEWEMTTTDLHLQPPATTPPAIFEWTQAPYRVRYRLPNSEDMLRAAGHPEAAAFNIVFASCIHSAAVSDADIDAAALPEDVRQALIARMAESDPQADIRMDLACPECRQAWSAPFDILSYLWTEVDNWSRRLIGEIAVLARAFGWTEPDILRLSPSRRRLYLDLVIAR